MKNVIGIVLSILVGGLLGFFGVFVSVFADSGLTERLVTIGVILLIYLVLGAVWSFLLPALSWKWGLLIGAPGVMFLGYYLLSGFNIFYLLYMALIISLASLGAWGGSAIKNHKRK
jgi:hypothetical protein